MWTSAELKTKVTFPLNYWKCAGFTVIFSIPVIFYVNPYKNLAETELYLTLKKNVIVEEETSEVME